MAQRRELTGQRFGKLIAIRPAQSTKQGSTWLCRCSCGGMKIAQTSYLVAGQLKSCGCIKRKWHHQFTDEHGEI